MKKFASLIIALVMLFSLSLSFSAETRDCICGRQYETGDQEQNNFYICPACQKNFLLCTCDCFCGHSAETVSAEDGTTLKICSGCKNPAVECTCVDRETALRLENDIRNGSISQNGVRLPQNPAALILALLIILLSAAFWIKDVKLIQLKKTDREKPTQNAEEETENKPEKADSGFEIYRRLHTLYEEMSPSFPENYFNEESDAVHLTERDVDLFKKALIGEETDISYFLNVISQKLLDSSLFPTEKGLHCAKILYEKTEDYRIGFGLYETARIFRDGERFDIRLEQGDKISLYMSVTAPEAASLLRRCINHRPKRDFELEKTNAEISKQEWILFIYLIYTGLKTFEKDTLRTKETISAFAKRTKSAAGREFRREAEKVIKDSDAFAEAFEGLSSKGIIEISDSGEYMIKENLRKDFDPERFMNIVYFEEVENGRPVLHLNFVLSNKGGVAVFEKDGKIKLLSSFTIPWSHYIR